jgi:hypothetical protein
MAELQNGRIQFCISAHLPFCNSDRHHVELLMMELDIRLHRNIAAD